MKHFTKLLAHLLMAACLTTLLPMSALAWGGEGHRITARVAWARMKQSTRNEILDILDGQGSLEHAATWPDTLYGNAAQWGYTFNWHFVDIPTESDHKYLESRDCPASSEGDCVIKALVRERATLTNQSSSATKRRAALRFIIHFMGDLHQPLHCAANNNDEGGNLKPVCFFNKCWDSEGKNLNLHKMWDKLMIQRTGLSETKYVENILARIGQMSPSEISAILNGDPIKWAEDAHGIAFERAYKLPATRQKKYNSKKQNYYWYYMLGQDYYDANLRYVDDQLLRGGVRLAAMLDDMLN